MKKKIKMKYYCLQKRKHVTISKKKLHYEKSLPHRKCFNRAKISGDYKKRIKVNCIMESAKPPSKNVT